MGDLAAALRLSTAGKSWTRPEAESMLAELENRYPGVFTSEANQITKYLTEDTVVNDTTYDFFMIAKFVDALLTSTTIRNCTIPFSPRHYTNYQDNRADALKLFRNIQRNEAKARLRLAEAGTSWTRADVAFMFSLLGSAYGNRYSDQEPAIAQYLTDDNIVNSIDYDFRVPANFVNAFLQSTDVGESTITFGSDDHENYQDHRRLALVLFKNVQHNTRRLVPITQNKTITQRRRPKLAEIKAMFTKRNDRYTELLTLIQDDIAGGRKTNHWIWYMFPQHEDQPGASYELNPGESVQMDVAPLPLYIEAMQLLGPYLQDPDLKWFSDLDFHRVRSFRQKHLTWLKAPPFSFDLVSEAGPNPAKKPRKGGAPAKEAAAAIEEMPKDRNRLAAMLFGAYETLDDARSEMTSRFGEDWGVQWLGALTAARKTKDGLGHIDFSQAPFDLDEFAVAKMLYTDVTKPAGSRKGGAAAAGRKARYHSPGNEGVPALAIPDNFKARRRPGDPDPTLLIEQHVYNQGRGDCLWYALRSVWFNRGNDPEESLTAWYAKFTDLFYSLFIHRSTVGVSEITQYRVQRVCERYSLLAYTANNATAVVKGNKAADDMPLTMFPDKLEDFWINDREEMCRYADRNDTINVLVIKVFGIMFSHLDNKTPIIPYVVRYGLWDDAYVTAVYGDNDIPHQIYNDGNHFDVFVMKKTDDMKCKNKATKTLAHALVSTYTRCLMNSPDKERFSDIPNKGGKGYRDETPRTASDLADIRRKFGRFAKAYKAWFTEITRIDGTGAINEHASDDDRVAFVRDVETTVGEILMRGNKAINTSMYTMYIALENSNMFPFALANAPMASFTDRTPPV